MSLPFAKDGRMKPSVTKDSWKVCPECKEPFSKYERLGEDGLHCRHCYTKLRHGVSDLSNCFKGSVIVIDE